MKRWIQLGIIGISLALGVMALVTYQVRNTPTAYVEDKKSYGTPDIGGPFTLVDHHGKTHTNEEFKNKIMVIYFGYSFCPDVCPLGLQNITAALNLLGRDIDQIAPIFVTIDPERDTSENLKNYAPNWHSSIVFLTGSQKQVGEAIRAYKVYAQKAKPDNTVAEYLMDHSTLIYVMGRDGKFLEAHPHTTEPDKLAEVLRKYVMPCAEKDTSGT